MSNVLICYANRADSATLADGSWNASFPLSNLANGDLDRAARSSSTAVTAARMRADLGAPYALRTVVLANHNLLTTHSWRVRAGNAPIDIDWAWAWETSDSRIAYSGAANGTRYYGSSIVAATAPRFDYTPVTGAMRGFLVEAAAQNLLLNTATLSTQSVTVTAAAHTLSFWGTGTVTLSGASTAGPLVGTGTTNRVTLTFTPSAGSLTLTVSGSVKDAQLELGSEATSNIVNVGSALTRTADVATISGADFTAAHSATGGTIYAEFEVNNTSGTRPIVSLDDGSSGERIELYASGTSLKFRVIDGGVTQCDLAIGTIAANTAYKAAAAWAANDFAGSLSGGATAVDAAGTLPTVDRMRCGADQAGNRLGGHLRRVMRWTTRRSDADLRAITFYGPDIDTVGGYDSGGAIVKQMTFYGDTPSDWGARYNVMAAFAAITARYVTIDLYASGLPYVQIGRLFIGGGFQPSQMNADRNGYQDSRRDLSAAEESLGGKLFTTARRRKRRTEFRLPVLTEAEGDQLHEMLDLVGTTGEVVYIPDPADMAKSQRYGGLGRLPELTPLDYPFYSMRGTGLRWEEKI